MYSEKTWQLCGSFFAFLEQCDSIYLQAGLEKKLSAPFGKYSGRKKIHETQLPKNGSSMFTSWNSTRKFREIKNTEKFLERSIKHDPKSNPYVHTVHKYSLTWLVVPSLILGTQPSSAKFKAMYPLPNCANLEVTCAQ